MDPEDQLCGPKRSEDRENGRAGRSGQKKSKGVEFSSTERGAPFGHARTPSLGRGPGTSDISDWGSSPYEEWYDRQGGSKLSKGSGSKLEGYDPGLRSGQVWQIRDLRRDCRGSSSRQGELGSEDESGASSGSGSGVSLSPAPDVFFSSSKSVRIPARARQVALPVHLYFRNKESVSLPQLQQLMIMGSLVWLNWNVGWEDKNPVRGTCR